MDEKIIYKEESYKIIGICMKVHKMLGKGFKEIVYKDAMELEFIKEYISYEREKPFDVHYEENILKHKFDADFYVYDKIILEVKARPFINVDAFRQTLNYLRSLKKYNLVLSSTLEPISLNLNV